MILQSWSRILVAHDMEPSGLAPHADWRRASKNQKNKKRGQVRSIIELRQSNSPNRPGVCVSHGVRSSSSCNLSLLHCQSGLDQGVVEKKLSPFFFLLLLLPLPFALAIWILLLPCWMLLQISWSQRARTHTKKGTSQETRATRTDCKKKRKPHYRPIIVLLF